MLADSRQAFDSAEAGHPQAPDAGHTLLALPLNRFIDQPARLKWRCHFMTRFVRGFFGQGTIKRLTSRTAP
jgi:hypothetical protein